MDLEKELAKFLAWLREYALPGFNEKAKDTYTDDYKIVYDELVVVATHMKHAAKIGNDSFFETLKKEYVTLFGQVNELIARQLHADALDHYLDEGLSNEDANKAAVEHLWANKAAAYWFPVALSMKGPHGQEVFLVANERHTPQGKDYVTISELESLRSSGRNPWEVVSNRRAYA